jgi:hypothetical protein
MVEWENERDASGTRDCGGSYSTRKPHNPAKARAETVDVLGSGKDLQQQFVQASLYQRRV